MTVIRGIIRRTGLIAVAAVVSTLAIPAGAQMMSESYEFLKAIKDRKGAEVTALLDTPGSTIVNTRDIATGETALHIVARRRDATWVRFLTAKGANPNIASNEGVTPIAISAGLSDIESVTALIKAGAAVDVADATGETPLIAAIHRRDLPLIRLLVTNGASVTRADNSGRNALDYARQLGDGRLDAVLEEATSGRKAGENKVYGPTFR